MWTPKVPSLTDEDDDMKIHPSFDVNSTYVRWLKTTDARRFQTSSAKQYINTTWSVETSWYFWCIGDADSFFGEFMDKSYSGLCILGTYEYFSIFF